MLFLMDEANIDGTHLVCVIEIRQQKVLFVLFFIRIVFFRGIFKHNIVHKELPPVNDFRGCVYW